MFLAGNKAKHILLVNHTTNLIHHHIHHHQQNTYSNLKSTCHIKANFFLCELNSFRTILFVTTNLTSFPLRSVIGMLEG